MNLSPQYDEDEWDASNRKRQRDDEETEEHQASDKEDLSPSNKKAKGSDVVQEEIEEDEPKTPTESRRSSDEMEAEEEEKGQMPASSEPNEESSSQQTPRPSSTPSLSVRLLFEARELGALIGRGGATIKKTRTASGAWIEITKSHPGITQRIMTLHGEKAKVHTALTMVTEQLHQAKSQKKEGLVSDVHLTALIPSNQVGAIIGKGGASIKRTREESGANVKVADEPMPNSTEKAVSIKGAPDAVSSALDTILDQLVNSAGNVTRKPPIPYVPFPAVDMMPYKYHPVPPPPPTAPYRQPTQLPNPYDAMPRQAMTTKQFVIPVPENYVGAIIGKRGATINDMRRRSGAQLKLADPNNSSERLLTITGSEQATQIALSLVYDKMFPNGQPGQQPVNGY